MAKREKLTKQGVRDLNHIKGKSVEMKLEEPPIPVDCKHRNKREVTIYSIAYVICNDCDETLYEW